MALRNTIKLTVWVVFLVQVFLCQGCNLFGFLASPSVFDEKIPPKYDLTKQKDKKIIVLIESVTNSGASIVNCKSLGSAVVLELTNKAKISSKSILFSDASILSGDIFSKTPSSIALDAGANLALYIRIESLDIVKLHSDKIYTGQLICRGVLIDTENDTIVWPESDGGEVANIGEDLATKGRDELIAELCGGAAHCMVRDLYACPKTEYRAEGERSVLNEMINQEVY